jgi:DNA ligase 1
VTLALWQGNALVPIARLPLTLAETPEIMGWIRANVSERFGPVRLVPPVHLFEIGFDGLSPNPRRKCGFDLLGATITRWLPDQGSSADHLDALNMAP